MLIACKFEEIYAPELDDFHYICDGAYTCQEIRDMEKTILEALNYELCHPTPIHFLRRFSRAARAGNEDHALAKYLTELAAIQYQSAVTWKPSLLAATCVHLASCIRGDTSWSPTMVHYTGYTQDDIMPVVLQVAQWARDAPTQKLNAVYRKYSRRFFAVSTLPIPTLPCNQK